jgi:RNase P/RNase MRP subunit p29
MEEEEIYKTIGKRIRILLPNNICYHGVVLDENENFLIIKDKFNNEVKLNKNHIISLEILR